MTGVFPTRRRAATTRGCSCTRTPTVRTSIERDGAIYAPKALLNLTGGSGTLGVQIIVSRLIGTGGSTNITVNYDPSLSAKPREPALVE